jgi:hypothetical protein
VTGGANAWPAGEDLVAKGKKIGRAVDSGAGTASAKRIERRSPGDLAVSAGYDPRSKRLCIELASGVAVNVPASRVQGLADVAAAKLKSVRIDGNGYGLHWPELDLAMNVPDLIAGCFGTRVWMTALARHGGKSTSAAKARAARKNGAKGGRPRGPTTASLSRRQSGR